MTSTPPPRNEARIRGISVPILVPAEGPVHVLLVGEAPGPRGADKSGYPFFGDGAGQHLYTALSRIGAMSLPPATRTMPWDGARFAAAGLRPEPHGVALGNALDRCPTDNGMTFRTPTRAELENDLNLARLHGEIARLLPRELRGIVTLGKVAARTVDACLTRYPALAAKVITRAVPHPSAQGLLSMAPNRGKGARLADLQETWMQQCVAAVIEAGYPAPDQPPALR
jgi:uracil-DNA glycosylase